LSSSKIKKPAPCTSAPSRGRNESRKEEGETREIAQTAEVLKGIFNKIIMLFLLGS